MDSLPTARTYALGLLKFRPRSESEFRQRLTQKRFGQATVEALVDEFKRKGLLDDERFAQYVATSRMLSKPVARRAIVAELKAKGVASDLATGAFEKAAEGRSELELAKEVAVKRMAHLKGLDRSTVERRLFGFLSRRGFSSEVIYQVMRALPCKVTSSGDDS